MDHRTLISCTAALLALTACSSTEPPATGAAPSASDVPAAAEASTTPSYDGPTIPDGDYRRVLDAAAKREAGVTLTDAELEWGQGGTITNTLRFRGDQWAQVADYDGGPPSVGSSGTLSYDERGGLVVYEACCGRSRYTWEIEGDTLTLVPDMAFARTEHPGFAPRSQEVRVWVMMSSGTYQRVG